MSPGGEESRGEPRGGDSFVDSILPLKFKKNTNILKTQASRSASRGGFPSFPSLSAFRGARTPAAARSPPLSAQGAAHLLRARFAERRLQNRLGLVVWGLLCFVV